MLNKIRIYNELTSKARIKKAWLYIERNFFLETKILPISKLLFTQTFLKQERITHHTNRIKTLKPPLFTSKDGFPIGVFQECDRYPIIRGNSRSYCATKLGFKQIEMRLYSPEIEPFWNRRLFYKGKPIRKEIDELIILDSKYNYVENNLKLDHLIFYLHYYLKLHGLTKNDFYYEGCLLNIKKNRFVVTKGYTPQEPSDEPLILFKDNFRKNTYLIIDGLERLHTHKKPEIDAWVFFIFDIDVTLFCEWFTRTRTHAHTQN